ncbi:MAG TPA: SDR family oxidoreductase [Candidatus Binatia bacterium]|nr:SDR family oxidoreductase [Candidatus Binatia bacterium]
MRILVTGGAGYVGSTLVPLLLREGHRVLVLDNLLYGGAGILPLFGIPGFDFVRGDVCDPATLKRALRGADAIIHLAALVGYPACKRDPDLAVKVNWEATRLLTALREPEQRIIYASTGSNYGAVVGEVCTEETPLRPLTLYGETKTKAEQEVLRAGNAIAFRFATAFGVSPRMRLDLLVNDFAYAAVRNRTLVIYEASFKRTFIHVRDMARAFLFALEHSDEMVDNAYNVGAERNNYSKREIAHLIQRHVDVYLHFADVGQDEDQRNYEVSYAKIERLGFCCLTDVEEGVRELVAAATALDVSNPYANV